MLRSRRSILLTLGAVALLGPAAALAGPRRRIRRRVRRRVRRVRRRVIWRTLGGRRLLVVPVAAAVGWELAIDNRVALIQSVTPQAVTVQYLDDNSTATVPAVIENTPENSQDLPGTEVEQEVEVEE